MSHKSFKNIRQFTCQCRGKCPHHISQSRIEFQTFQLDAALRGKQIPGVNTAIGFTAWWFNHHQIQT
jgi:hypothetical protein